MTGWKCKLGIVEAVCVSRAFLHQVVRASPLFFVKEKQKQARLAKITAETHRPHHEFFICISSLFHK